MVVVIKKKAAPTIQEQRTFNPNLASDWEPGVLNYKRGYVILPKLNGVRGGVQNGVLLSRTMKPIANDYTRGLFSNPLLSGVEGELVVGSYRDENVFVNSTSGVMSMEGMPDVILHMFDFYHPTWPFIQRIRHIHQVIADMHIPRTVAVPFYPVSSDEEVDARGAEFVALGYEGGVVRATNMPYKEGRSTLGEGGAFLRWVPWHTSEAVIQGITEGQVNNNESVRNALGYLEKSSHKDNKSGSGRAGSMQVKDLKTGIEFSMPVPGVDLQKDFWDHPEKYVEKVCRYKFKQPVKKGGKPRFPQYEGLRHPDDM